MTRYRLYINNTDATATWGVNLDEGAVDVLTAFRPNKEPVTNKNVTATGAVVVCGAGLVDERTVALPLNITAKSFKDFVSNRDAFYAAIKNGALSVVVKLEFDSVRLPKKDGTGMETVTPPADTVFSSTMYYVNCNQYTHFEWLPEKKFSSWEGNTRLWNETGGEGGAKFILSLYEPNA